jgi:hypothetical protein
MLTLRSWGAKGKEPMMVARKEGPTATAMREGEGVAGSLYGPGKGRGGADGGGYMRKGEQTTGSRVGGGRVIIVHVRDEGEGRSK